MSDEYIKPVSDDVRNKFQEMLLGESKNEVVVPKFASKNVKASELVDKFKVVLQESGVDIKSAVMVQVLANLYQNLSSVFK